MQDFGRAQQQMPSGIDCLTVKDEGIAEKLGGEQSLRAAILTVLAGGQPKAMGENGMEVSYVLRGDGLELRHRQKNGGNTKPFAEVILKSGSFNPHQVAALMQALNPPVARKPNLDKSPAMS